MYTCSLGYMMSINTLTACTVLTINYYGIDSSYSLLTTSTDVCEVQIHSDCLPYMNAYFVNG